MRTDTDRLDWLEANPNYEVRYVGYYGEDIPWEIIRIYGGINDREAETIAEGDTLREVIDAGMAHERRRS
jgi:hypothetical protein